MLTLENVSEELETLYVAFKTLSTDIYAEIETLGQTRLLKSEVDLFTLNDNGAIIYIKEGYFRLIFGNKVVRLYSENDFIGSMQQIKGASLSSEFAAEVAVFNWAETISLFSRQGKLLSDWFSLMNLENKINLGLCAHLIDERVHPSLDLQQFKDGEVIIAEGTKSEEIFEMITGRAQVTVSGTEVGLVETGEIFGEMSALVDCERTASVIAEGRCCVRVVKREDFFKLLEADRHLSAGIAKTLAKRIIELNKRLADRSTAQ